MMPEMSFPSEFKKEMLKLQVVYAGRLKGHIAEMKRLQDVVGQTPMPRDEVQKLHGLAHKIAESGTAFGYPDVSRSARELYLALDRLLAPGLDDDRVKAHQSEVLFRLKFCDSVCQEAVNRKPQEAAEQMYEPEAPKLRILEGEEDIYVVADGADRSFAETMAHEIAQFGYNAHVTAADAEDFHKAFIEGHMKAAVVFSEMRDRDSEYIRALRAENAYVPVVILSPYEDFEARLRAARAGAQGYFAGRTETLRIVDKIERLSEQYAPHPDYHVLVVDDDEMLTEFYRCALQRTGLKVSVINKPRDVPAFMARNEVDLALIDNEMPDCGGLELAAIIRQHDQHVGVPIVFLSPQEEIDRMLRGAGPGIDDFIAKPFTAQHVLNVVKSRARRAAELKSLLVHDNFTGLYNHEHFMAQLSHEIMRTKRTGSVAAYGVIDIDHLKQINISHGHHAGDQVIKMISHMLRHHLRTTDIIGRCSGEAFGVIMPGCDLKHGRESLERFRAKATASFFPVGNHKIHVTFSGGVALIDGKQDADAVIKAADAALERAKTQGRNQVVADGKDKR